MPDTPTLTWSTHEREYSRFQDRFLKRSLRPTEYKLDFRGQPYVPVANEARLENEAACLRFIKAATNIPVPEVLAAYEKDGSFFLWTEICHGIPMKELSVTDQAVVIKELEGHLRILQTLRSNRIGGPTGIICPPPRVSLHFPKDKVWPSISSSDDEFVFCHDDLSQFNVIVDKDTLTISGIIDWEFAGYYPSYFESPFYRSSKPSGAQVKDLPDTSKLISFFAVRFLTDCLYG
ncbi:kinase-like protein [Hyaloscypha bicolor E]|uniref:Kinase-like protein n=1 Tax=Hyaloscypha bicolor E TaxID=1095630 RepID=A0A2J6TAY7_9HELO|nr:kinase-like protein [Hyaloscypha bicolor E]PMD60200.1 kinase-like protein [Hyaloscypha bicolor E]